MHVQQGWSKHFVLSVSLSALILLLTVIQGNLEIAFLTGHRHLVFDEKAPLKLAFWSIFYVQFQLSRVLCK